MKSFSFAFAVVLSLVVVLASFPGQPAAASSSPSVAGVATSVLRQEYGNLSLSFEVNRGQADRQVAFLAHGHGFGLFLTATDAVLFLRSVSATRGMSGLREMVPGPASVTRLHFDGANPHPRIVGLERLPGMVNYFLSNDPRRWRTEVPTYARVEYRDVYPGIDLVFYGRQGHLEYDWVVRPGADPRRISLGIRSDGLAMPLCLDTAGNLVMRTGAGTVLQRRPLVYQIVQGVRVAVRGTYHLQGGSHVSFGLGSYDTRRPLVIDPVLVYSTFLGGSQWDVGFGIAADAAGNAYFTGGTDSSADFPRRNPAQGTFGGVTDAFVTKLGPTGQLIYSTFLGGSLQDVAQGIAVDSSGSAYVTGYTLSANFPTTSGAFISVNPNSTAGQAFVTKLDPTGSSLAYSTYLGGGSGPSTGHGIAVDTRGQAYVTGETAAYNFPTMHPLQRFIDLFDDCNGCPSDAFVSELNATGSGLVFSTFWGGRQPDVGYGIALDPQRNIYVTGYTSSADFPKSEGALQTTLHGNDDAFVSRFAPDGASLMYSTYLGGENTDAGQAIAADASGNAYVTGYTFSSRFPTTPTAFQRALGTGGAPNCDDTSCFDAFVSKLNPNGGSLVYSSYLGGGGIEQGFGIAVDGSGDAYVTGLTMSTNFPHANTTHLTLQGSGDAFVTEFNPAGTDLIFSGYLGGSDFDQGHGIAVDASGNIYVTGHTLSADFPVDAFQPTYGGATDGFVTKFSPVPTAARVSRFTATRRGTSVLFRWHMAVSTGVAAFNLYARRHRLNRRPIAAHQAPGYRYRSTWTGLGPFSLEMVLASGETLRIRAQTTP